MEVGTVVYVKSAVELYPPFGFKVRITVIVVLILKKASLLKTSG
jgi:hypothetical protein